MTPSVAAIVVGWNSKKDLPDCLNSLLEQDYENLKIVFVDNASIDGSADFVRTNFPTVTVVEPGKNLFFGGGNNFGMQYAWKEWKSDYFALLNPDAAADKDWISQSIKILQKDEQIAAVGPLVKFWQKFIDISFIYSDSSRAITLKTIATTPDDYHKIVTEYTGWQKRWEVDKQGNWLIENKLAAKIAVAAESKILKLEAVESGHKPTIVKLGGDEYKIDWQDNQAFVSLKQSTLDCAQWIVNSAGTMRDWFGVHYDRGYGDYLDEKFKNDTEVDGVNGVAMMLSAKALQQVGLFDLRYQMYVEETELCERFIKAGFKNQYIGSTQVRHKHMQSTSQQSRNRYLFWTSRHQLLLIWDYFGKRKFLIKLKGLFRQNVLLTFKLLFSLLKDLVRSKRQYLK